MAVLKIVPGDYLNHDALEKLIHYVYRKAIQIGGYGVDPQYAAEQMRLVKQYWLQDHGKQLRHVVLCLNSKESSMIDHVNRLAIGAYQVCQYYYEGGYQSVFGIHRSTGTSNWHIHYIVNNVSFTTGEHLPENKRQDYRLRDHVMTCYLPSKQIEVCYY